jgi:hypothetical protein
MEECTSLVVRLRDAVDIGLVVEDAAGTDAPVPGQVE